VSRRWKWRIAAYALLAAALAGGWYGVMWLADRVYYPPNEPNVVYATTPQDAVDKMLEMARVTKDDVVYDLGCGDARFLTTAAKRYGCRGVGWELRPEVVATARQKVAEAGVGDLVTIHEGNIFDSRVDIRDATVLTLFLLPELNEKLIPKFKTLRPGARIVSFLFDTPGMKPKDVVVHYMPNTKRDCRLLLWETPLQFE
jgi:SAM-dependent methyltransferase